MDGHYDGFPSPEQERQEERLDVYEGVLLLVGLVMLVGGGLAAFWCISTYMVSLWTLPLR